MTRVVRRLLSWYAFLFTDLSHTSIYYYGFAFYTISILDNGSTQKLDLSGITNYLNAHYQIMLTIACRDVGQPCDCVLSGETEEELLKSAAEHAVNDHGYKEEEIMTPEMQQNIKSHIKRV